MGKKRRLKCAKAKFALKHSAHPRAKFLASQEASPPTAPTVEVIEETITAPPPPVEPKIVETPTLTAKKEEPVATPAPPTKNTTKKTKTVKKTTTSRKRSTKRKTKKTTPSQSL